MGLEAEYVHPQAFPVLPNKASYFLALVQRQTPE
jgi:hypothetical protein